MNYGECQGCGEWLDLNDSLCESCAEDENEEEEGVADELR